MQTSTAQDLAAEALALEVHSVEVGPSPLSFLTGCARLVGRDTDGRLRVRAYVRPDGAVASAFDPDKLLSEYLRSIRPQRRPLMMTLPETEGVPRS